MPAHPVVDPEVPVGLPDAAAAARGARRDRSVGSLEVTAPPVARDLQIETHFVLNYVLNANCYEGISYHTSVQVYSSACGPGLG